MTSPGIGLTSQAGTAPQLATRALANGLRVVVEYDRAAPAVAVNLTYRVGSCDEVPGLTGLAHLFEHLMFQGSANAAAGEHTALLEATGAETNAFTTFERTTYHETLPRGAVPLALWLEADRMASLVLNQAVLDNERDVVKNERMERVDNMPYGSNEEHALARCFPVGHPLHHSPIGFMEDIEGASLDDTAQFFRRHYLPGNAVLTLVGDIEPADAFSLAEHHFGQIPAGEVPPRPEIAALGPMLDAEHLEVHEDVPMPAVFYSWRTPGGRTPMADAVQVAMRILADGRASRLTNRLVREDELAIELFGYVMPMASGDSVARLMAFAGVGKELSEIEAAIDEELARLAADGPSADELARAIALTERSVLDDSDDLTQRADVLAEYAVLYGDPDLANHLLDRIRTVTASGVQQAAALLAPRHALRLRYFPDDEASSLDFDEQPDPLLDLASDPA